MMIKIHATTTKTAAFSARLLKLMATAWLWTMPLATAANYEDDYCCLCSQCRPRVRGEWVVAAASSGQPTTCDQLGLHLSQTVDPSTTECLQEQDAHRDTCCEASYTPPATGLLVVEPTPAPTYQAGPHPVCNLCIDGSFPRKPFTITAALEIEGNPTCRDLYYLGLAGHLSYRHCYPLQDYMVGPCGCPPTSLAAATPTLAPAVGLPVIPVGLPVVPVGLPVVPASKVPTVAATKKSKLEVADSKGSTERVRGQTRLRRH